MHGITLQLYARASREVLACQIVGSQVDIGLVHSDGPARTGCQFAWIILIENALGPFDIPRRNFGGAIKARLGIDGEVNRSG